MSPAPGPGSARRAAIVATGDELVHGQTVDLNSSAISRELLGLGWVTGRIHVVPDDEVLLAGLYRELARDHALVVSTGGLGPTLDDLTREAVARALDVPLECDEDALRAIRAWFEASGREMAGANERQAFFPRGAEVLPNARGTAPGFRVEVDGAELFVLPGPPHEMQAMLAAEVLPRLAARSPAGAVARHTFHLFGLPESTFAEQAGDWMARDARPRIGVSARLGVLRVTLHAEGPDEGSARGVLDARAAEFRERFGASVYSEDEPDLAAVLGRELIDRGLSISVAESCTGGLLAGALTRVPGISAVLSEGFVTYSSAAKVRLLGVDAATLERHGAVSSEVAAEMAAGAARVASADLAISITGVAGPGGGTEEKPVGLVWFGICLRGVVETVERRFTIPRRDAVRELAVHTALDLARRRVEVLPKTPAGRG